MLMQIAEASFSFVIAQRLEVVDGLALMGQSSSNFWFRIFFSLFNPFRMVKHWRFEKGSKDLCYSILSSLYSNITLLQMSRVCHAILFQKLPLCDSQRLSSLIYTR